MVLFLVVLMAAAAGAVPATNNPMMNPNLFEGDILGLPIDADRSAVPYNRQTWTDGVVPYNIDISLASQVDIIRQGMEHIENYTCIKFVPKGPEHDDFINITLAEGCNSYWGRLGGVQRVSLGYGCHLKSIVVHELMHALGFIHEQNRPDRDDYLTINYENIEQRWHFAFRKLSPHQTRLLTPFDYDSVMLYGEMSFSKAWGLKSMEAKDGRFLAEAHTKPGMSKGDKKRINMLYGCPLREDED